MDHHLKLPISSNELLKQLDKWKIIYKHFTHEPLISVNESKLLQEKLFGNNKENGHIKNLYLRDKKKNNISILLSSHNMQEAQTLCDNIMILKKGKVIEQGQTNIVLDKHKKKKLEDVYFKIFGEK